VRRAAWIIPILLGGCGDEAVDVSLQLPSAATSAMYDTSCVSAVEVYVDGGNYPTDDGDYLLDCIDVTKPGATFADLRERIRGQFDMKIPASGLSGIELYAYNGTCNAAYDRDFDLIAYGSAPYAGQDEIQLPILPNLSCAQAGYQLRAVDILKYSKTANCDMSTWTGGRLGLATITPLPFTGEAYWWGGQAATAVNGGVVTVYGRAQGIGAKSCLAAWLDTDQDQVTCMPPAEQRVCATGGELEAPVINPAVGYGSANPAKISQWGAVVYGVVVGPGPLANATVTIDPADKDKGEVVYFEMPPGVETGTGMLRPLAGTATGPNGLFAVYTQSMVRITVTSGGKSVTRLIGVEEDFLGAVIVKL
jgi:hypothetical protein